MTDEKGKTPEGSNVPTENAPAAKSYAKPDAEAEARTTKPSRVPNIGTAAPTKPTAPVSKFPLKNGFRMT